MIGRQILPRDSQARWDAYVAALAAFQKAPNIATTSGLSARRAEFLYAFLDDPEEARQLAIEATQRVDLIRRRPALQGADDGC